MRTSEESCLRVWVKFLEASARARVSNMGLVADALALWELLPSHLHAVTLSLALLTLLSTSITALLSALSTLAAGTKLVTVSSGVFDSSSTKEGTSDSGLPESKRARKLLRFVVTGLSFSFGDDEQLLSMDLLTIDVSDASGSDVLDLLDVEGTDLKEEERLELPELLELELLGVTVDSCSWISIMWSPRRIVRFNGAFPERKSLTCNKRTDYNNLSRPGFDYKTGTVERQ